MSNWTPELEAINEEIVERVKDWMEQHDLSDPPHISIGYECECGEIPVFAPGEIYEEGECYACGKRSKVTLDNYVLLMASPGGPGLEVGWREGEGGIA